VEKGELLLRKGTTLEPAHLALLAAVGYQQVPVYPAPKIAILATGSELLKKGGKARPGMIHDSNTVFLESLVKKTGGIPYPFANVGDDPEEIRKRVRKGLSFDLVLVSGGVSVGKYDFVKEIFRKEGIQEIFWKVDIKPGKPLFLGRKRRTLVFGLPGNPVSVFVCFEEFVKPAILRMQGKMKLEGDLVPGRLRESFRNGPRLHFVRVRCIRKKDESIVIPLKGQGSHMIGELASAHALLKVEPNTFLKRNQLVSVKMIGDL
jgi:molybdopterin molybdotransferase